MKNVLFPLTVAICFAFSSCQNNPGASKEIKSSMDAKLFLGSWVQPNPGNEKEVQGFTLYQDGIAHSINMETLKYRKWWVESNNIVFVAESIGNHTSSVDTFQYEVVKINGKELELKSGEYLDSYKKQ
jgi:hypothetical protein